MPKPTLHLSAPALGGALAAALAVGFGLGWLVGRPGAAAAARNGGSAGVGAGSPGPSNGSRAPDLADVRRGGSAATPGGAGARTGASGEALPPGHAHAHDDDPPPDLDRYPPGSFDRLFAEFIGQMREEAVPAGPLGEALLRDPGLLDEALARLQTERDPQKLAALAALLGQVHHPAVDALAVQLAQGADPQLRAAALDILDAFETPAAVAPAVAILAHERSPDLVARAIHALPEPCGFGAAEAAPVAAELRRQATGAEDAEVRRRAALAYAHWGGADAEEVLILSLRGDPSPDVRAAAAFGLEARRARSAEAIGALVAAMQRQGEARIVRDNAYQALSRVGPLPPAAAAAYRAYEIEREGG
jgi:hypothetical protein